MAGGSTVRRELLLHDGQGGLAGVDAGHVPEKDPRLSFLDRVQHVVQNGRELQERGRGGPAVKHRTSVTFMMCSCSRVMSAGDSMLLLPRVSARGALRFQRKGVFMSKHSLMNSRCVLDSCCSGLWSSFKHLAGFLKLKRMPWVEPFEHQASDRHRRGPWARPPVLSPVL